MSLWIDKYRPQSLRKLSYHNEQAAQLAHLVTNDDFPHLLVYGPPGSGKKTRVQCILNELYGSAAQRMSVCQRTVEAPSGKKIELATLDSSCHLEVNPSDCGIHDRVVVQELIKTVAPAASLDPTKQRRFKVIVIHEADRLTRDAQFALRRTMERYAATCRLILVATSSSCVHVAIRSRCLPVRVAAPRVDEISTILIDIGRKEGVRVDEAYAKSIATQSDRNLRVAILMLETAKIQLANNTVSNLSSTSGSQQPVLDERIGVPEREWITQVRAIARSCVDQQTPQRLLEVRGRTFDVLSRCVPPTSFFRVLIEELLRNCDASMRTELIELAASYEHRLQQGTKPILHIEAFVARFMSLFKQYLEDGLRAMDFDDADFEDA